VGFYGLTESNTRIPAEGNFVIRGMAYLADSKHKVYDELCLHRANLTFAWNDEDFKSVHSMGRFGGCADKCAYEYDFGDNDYHTRNEDYRLFDRLGVSWYASTGHFALSPPHTWEVLPHDPPPGFAEGWDVEVPLPSRASTRITYTHFVGGLPTYDPEGWPLNLAYNGCFDSANGWGEWDYGFYPGGTTNASFWAPRIGRDRSGAWVLRKHSRVFQRLEGLEPDTEYGLSFYVYHPYVPGDVGRFDVIGRVVDGVPDLDYVYQNLTLAQDDAWEQVAVRARTDPQGQLYIGIELGLSDADWLALDDLMVWADPDGIVEPRGGDCGAPNCDLLSNGPVDVDVSGRHLHLTREGWPSPNPIVITATWDLEDEVDADWNGYLQIKVKNLLGERTRVFLVPPDGESENRLELGIFSDVQEPNGDSHYYDSAGTLYYHVPLTPTNRVDARYRKIWVQPSEQARLEIEVEVIDAYGMREAEHLWDRTCVSVPQADIHPVVFVHGILGSMPPQDDIFYDWPHERVGALPGDGGTLLDPWLDSYTPMMDNLVKMGYEPGQSMFIVTYNWMQSNRVSAHWLDQKLQEINNLSTHDYIKNDKVDLLVHSMGGLVSRAYVEGLANKDSTTGDDNTPYRYNVNKLIFVATPHRGFPITYRTWEGVTWEEYLSEEVRQESQADAGPTLPVFEAYVRPGLLRTMDEILWPYMILKRYRPSSDQPCHWHRSLRGLIPNMGWMDAGRGCPKEALYHYSHSDDPDKGVWSLPEMLPPVTDNLYREAATRPIPPYLHAGTDEQPCGNDGDYPCGVQVNPLLEGFALNAPWNVDLLAHRLGENIYALYGEDTRTDAEYNVVNKIHLPWSDTEYEIPLWQNGFPKREPVELYDGDNLIPTYSTRLYDDGMGLLGDSLDKWHEIKADLKELAARHKGIMYHPRAQRAVGWILSGLGERSDPNKPDSHFTFPFFSTYKAPHFWYDNQNAFWCLVWWSPVDGLITDPLGRRVGTDPTTGEYVNEIPGAFYSGNETDMEFLLLPDVPQGAYTVAALGTGAGDYALTAYRVDAGGARLTNVVTSAATPGQTVTHSLAYSLPTAPLFSDDVENGGNNWSAEGWSLVTDQAHSSVTAWASDDGSDATVGQAVTLTLNATLDLSGTKMARLTLWHSYTLSAGGRAMVQLSTDRGQTWGTAAYRQNEQAAWTPLEVDLTPLLIAGEPRFDLRLVLQSGDSSDRWWVDDVVVEAILPPEEFGVPFYDDVEGWRRWDTTGAWEPVTHTAHSGLWAWQGTGNGATLALHRPLMLTGTLAPQLSFWYTGSLAAGDAGLVEVSSNAGQIWTPVLTVTGPITSWTQATASLSGPAGERPNLRLRLASPGGEASWTVDDVAITDALPMVVHALPFADDVEAGSNWQAVGHWATVTTTTHSGATSWRGYGDDAALILADRLALTDTMTPALNLWQRFDLPEGSVGKVKVTLNGGLDWQPVLTVTGLITAWTPISVDLNTYAGEEIGLDFYLIVPLTATVAPGQGWYIDDMLVDE
jgi:hypothetical protein